MNCTEHCVVPPELKRQNLSTVFFCKCRMSLKIKSSNRNQAACELQQVTAHCVGLNLTKRRKRHGVTRAFNKQNKFDHIFLNKCNSNPYFFPSKKKIKQGKQLLPFRPIFPFSRQGCIFILQKLFLPSGLSISISIPSIWPLAKSPKYLVLVFSMVRVPNLY